MLPQTWMIVLVEGAALAAAAGAGLWLNRRPRLRPWRNTWFGRLPWYFYGSAAVFFLSISLYSSMERSNLALVAIHGWFATLEAYFAAQRYRQQQPTFHVAHLALPALVAATLAAALYPLSAVALPVVSGVFAAAVLVLFVRNLLVPAQAQA